MTKQNPIRFIVLMTFIVGGFLYLGEAELSAAADRLTESQYPTDVITVCESGCDYQFIIDAIAAAHDGDTIQLFTGVYDEESLVITKTLSIVGNGADNTIIQTADGPTTTTVRVFAIMPNAVVSIDGVTIRNGAAYDTGLEQYGGGILVNQGVLTLTNSVLHSNQASLGGGGIYITATTGTTAALTIRDSTIYGNTTDGVGGGIAAESGPGGILRVDIINSTIGENVGDQSGGGMYFGADANAQFTVTQTTIYQNSSQTGKQIHLFGGRLALAQSILGGGSGGSDCQQDGGTIVDGRFNLVTDGSCGFDVGGNPQLGMLQNNGSATLTYALSNGSPALDVIPPQNCATNVDQRSILRPFGPGCDIGSFELNTTGVLFNQYINGIPFPEDESAPDIRLAPEQYITITLDLAPQGAGFSNGVITATIPDEFNLLAPAILDPPDAGVLGTFPVLAHTIVVTANHQLTVIIHAQVAWGIPGETELFQSFGFTSTEITTPTIITGTPIIDNVPPTARDDHCPISFPECPEFSTSAAQVFVTGNVFTNDSDANGDTIQCTGGCFNDDETRGIVTYNGDGTFTYDPAGRFNDESPGIIQDTFSYTVDDGQGGLDTAVVQINVIRSETTIFLPLVIR